MAKRVLPVIVDIKGKVYAAASKIPAVSQAGGYGLFANRDLPAGTMIGPYGFGLKMHVRKFELLDPEIRKKIDRYAISVKDGNDPPELYAIDPTNSAGEYVPTPQNMCPAANEPPPGVAANCRYVPKYLGMDGEPLEELEIPDKNRPLDQWIMVCQDLKRGEELLVYYSDEYSRDYPAGSPASVTIREDSSP